MKSHCLEVAGDYACFTRPEMKVERVSYDVMTPSAARAILDAILWKPAIRWKVHRIDVLKPIRWMSLRRNEVGAVASIDSAKEAMTKGCGSLGLFVEEERQQRAGLFLRDVAYRIHASFSLTKDAGSGDNEGKFAEMFVRRARSGQCFNQPYLGCREFACDFRYVDSPSASEIPATRDLGFGEPRDLGFMLYDLDFGEPAAPRPRFFRATLRNGSLDVPAWDSPEVLG
jgi:CRISPR-associated protein Cas5d